MPKIKEMLMKLESLQYSMLIDLNMGYYHIQLSKNSSILCMIIFIWEKYCYKRLPMEVSNSTNIFQQKMNDLFHGSESIRA